MTAPSTRLAYTDAFEALDKALEDPEGIRMRMGSKAEAYTMRSRLHYARRIDRRDNSLTEPEGTPLHGRSVFDPLIVRIKVDVDGYYWIYIERAKLGEDKIIESLSAEEEIDTSQA